MDKENEKNICKDSLIAISQILFKKRIERIELATKVMGRWENGN